MLMTDCEPGKRNVNFFGNESRYSLGSNWTVCKPNLD